MQFLNKLNLLILAMLCFTSVSWGKGVVVLAGGGEDGKLGDKSGWSYSLYQRMVKNGDINGDGKVKVMVMTYYKPDTEEVPAYFKNLGADSAEHVIVTNREEANDPRLVDKVKDADVLFFRGGDQAEYYRNWKDTRLFGHIKKVVKDGGAIGGTSAGAMSMAGYALAGGQELGTKDALSDAHSPLLDDERGGTSIHNDFIGAVPDAIVETHFGERARLGRIIGVHAKASDDFKRKDLVAIAVSEQTGVAIENGRAQVYGNGTVEFIRQTPETKLIRKPGEPLVYTDLRNDVLTEGMVYDMKKKVPDLDTLPAGVKPVKVIKRCGSVGDNLSIDGNKKSDAQKFEYHPKYGKANYKLERSPKGRAQLKGVIGLPRAHSYDEDPSGGSERAKIQAALYRAIYDQPGRSAILLPEEGTIKRVGSSGQLIGFEKNPKNKEAEVSSMVLDCSDCTHTGLSPRVGALDNGSKTLRLPTLVNMRVHVLGSSQKHDVVYNLRTHKTQGAEDKIVDLACTVNTEKELLELKQNMQEVINSTQNCEE